MTRVPDTRRALIELTRDEFLTLVTTSPQTGMCPMSDANCKTVLSDAARIAGADDEQAVLTYKLLRSGGSNRRSSHDPVRWYMPKS